MNIFFHGSIGIRFGFWIAAALAVARPCYSANWPAWHGPAGSGVSPETELPLRWSEKENIRWKVELPRPGNSSPIIWGTRVFITQAVDKERTLACYDRANGKLLWQKGTTNGDPEETHESNPYCSASPVTDGERVIAWFGSAGVFCYDFNGRELWRRDLGKQQHEWGYAASPIMRGDFCFIHFGPGERSFLTALNKETGQTAWQVDLPQASPKERTDGFAGQSNGVVGSWSTPIVIKAAGRDEDELVLSIPGEVRSFDLKTGREWWRCDGLNPLIYTSPIFGDGVVVAMGGYAGSAVAVRPGGEGNVIATHRLWQKVRTKNRIGCGVIRDGHIYILNTPGVAECIALDTGAVVWEERLRAPGPKTESWSSMILAGDRIYVLNQSGDTVVLKASPKFEVLAVNSIGNELTNSTLGVSEGELFLRTHKHLWCISGTKTSARAQ